MVAGTWEHGVDAPQDGAFRGWLKAQAAAQAGRTFLWAPVALTFGIWTYFSLAREPSWALSGPCAAAAVILFWAGRARAPLMLAALVLSGFVLAKARADWVAAPVLHATTPPLAITGTVEDASYSSARRIVVILGADRIEGFVAVDTPKRLRLTGSGKAGLPGIGTRVALTTMLAPLPSATMPGGFDYGRDLWFDGIGGTGRITGTIETLDDRVPWRFKLKAAVEQVRLKIGERIRQHLDGVNASFAEALIDGERSTIPKEVNQSLLASGLFHILSISGLHMWLVAGGIFWMVRAALATIPVLALRWPIKKWAAAAALAVGYFYMLLADSGVSTQRSYIMIAVVFFAVIVDRPAISVRNLAFAAMVILVLEPEAAVQASFQMSFLAVMGLAAYYEFWAARRQALDGEYRQRQGWIARAAAAVATAVAVSLITTIVAGAMSSIPAAYHFGRLAPYGILANGLALPVISFLVMPMALVATLLMPLGLEAWPLWAMAKGLDLVMAISDWVASLPGAHVVVARQNAGSAIVMAAGAVCLSLLAGPLRLAGIAIMAAGLALSQAGDFPDILVERTGANVAFRNGDGELVPALDRRGRFAIEKWLLANGEEITTSDAMKRPGWTCTETRCAATVKGKTVTYLREKPGAVADCGGIDILIADYPLRGACRAVPLRIDRFDLWRSGAHAVTVEGGVVTVTTSRGLAGDRRWVVKPEPRKDRFKRP